MFVIQLFLDGAKIRAAFRNAHMRACIYNIRNIYYRKMHAYVRYGTQPRLLSNERLRATAQAFL